MAAGTRMKVQARQIPERLARSTLPEAGLLYAFFDRFARALTTGDVETLASMWETPAFVLSDDGARIVSSAQEIESFFARAKDTYNARGITDTVADIVWFDWVTPRMALVQVRWPYLDREGSERGEETSTYTVRANDAGELKLRVAVAHGASTGPA